MTEQTPTAIDTFFARFTPQTLRALVTLRESSAHKVHTKTLVDCARFLQELIVLDPTDAAVALHELCHHALISTHILSERLRVVEEKPQPQKESDNVEPEEEP